jgi:glutamate-5-semialdehyde dehydrogenase
MKSVLPLLIRTHAAATSLQNASDRQIRSMLRAVSAELIINTKKLIKANQKDLSVQAANNSNNDRLLLNEQRIKNIAKSIINISRLPDPSGKTLEKRILKNGLKLEKISVPLGVVGAIYESRPNVTFDIAALCLRSRNACVLKGSVEAEHTNKASIAIIKKALKAQGFNADTVTLLPSERTVVNEMFTATKYIDVLIPRGSEGLI